MERKKIVAGNWKMNKTHADALALATALTEKSLPSDVTVVVCTPSVYCAEVGKILAKHKTLNVGAQNCHHEESGAYTGETSAAMLQSIGVEYVIIGHSERREYQKETGDVLVKKVNSLLAKNMKPIYCCGEPLEIRESGKHISYVRKQIKTELYHLDKDAMKNIVIAYEPIWAIGTGLTASAEQAQEMHLEIREAIQRKYGKRVSDKISILYGGSANAANAKTLFSQPDVDGGLIGGASLKADDFATICNSYS